MKINLYKIVDDELRWVDYGVFEKVESYVAQGYIVIICRNTRCGGKDVKQQGWSDQRSG